MSLSFVPKENQWWLSTLFSWWIHLFVQTWYGLRLPTILTSLQMGLNYEVGQSIGRFWTALNMTKPWPHGLQSKKRFSGHPWYDISAAIQFSESSFTLFLQQSKTGQPQWTATGLKKTLGSAAPISPFRGALGFMTLRYLSMTGDFRPLFFWSLGSGGAGITSRHPGEWYLNIYIYYIRGV